MRQIKIDDLVYMVRVHELRDQINCKIDAGITTLFDDQGAAMVVSLRNEDFIDFVDLSDLYLTKKEAIQEACVRLMTYIPSIDLEDIPQ